MKSSLIYHIQTELSCGKDRANKVYDTLLRHVEDVNKLDDDTMYFMIRMCNSIVTLSELCAVLEQKVNNINIKKVFEG